MSTAVITAAASDGYIQSNSSTYATARAGGGSLTPNDSSSLADIGQIRGGATRSCLEAFFSFDTTGITNIESVVLSLYGVIDTSTTDFTIEARTASWASGGLTSADWVPGANLSAQTLLASLSTASFVTSAYNDLTSQSGFVSAINPSGATDIIVVSSRLTTGVDPTGDEYVTVSTGDDPTPTIRPILTIQYDVRKLQVVTSPMRW